MSVEFSKPIDNWARRKHPSNSEVHSRVEEVCVDFGTSLVALVNEPSFENPLKDRAIRLLYRMRSDACEGVEAGSVLGMGSGIGAGIATLLTCALAENNSSVEGVVIAVGLSIGASGSIVAGLASGMKGGVLVVSGVAGVAAGSIVSLGIENATEVVTGAILSTGAATAAAVAAGIFLKVTSGVITRRNWPY